MAKLTWKITNQTQSNLDITQYVRSLSFTQGRPSPLSPYSGNSASITMSSYGGIENYVAINDTIRLEATPTGGVLWQIFDGFVTSRTFDDNPGTGINSLMTVSLNDPMLQAGMANLQNQSLVSVNDQIDEIVAELPQIPIFSNGTDVDISVGSFTTNANQRINEIIVGDRGVLQSDSGSNAYTKPSDFDLIVYNSLTFGRTTSATQIAYQDIVRVEAASNSLFYTQATVTGSASTVTKTSQFAFIYGVRTFTATTAQSNVVSQTAEWYANAFTDPELVMLNLTFTDVAQNETALQEFAELLTINMFVQVSYTPPGGVSTTGYYWPEQITVNATVDQTSITMLMSPQTYYANFILDDAVFGVLDTDRLGV
jgi:hypothetical protein